MKPVELLKTVFDIRDLIWSTAKEIGVWIDERKNEGFVSCYVQMEKGLGLRYYYGLPSSLRTPWGSHNISGGGSGKIPQFKELHALLCEHLGLVEVSEKRITHYGEFGPIYHITSLNGVDLPAPSPRAYQQFRPQDEVREELNALLMEIGMGHLCRSW